MKVSFELSMPGVNSWNGRWSGEGRKYVVVRTFGDSKKSRARILPLIDKGYFHYSFGDGWRAGVTVKQVESKEARQLIKRSAGFCGYDWMIDSIIYNGKIQTKQAA